MFLLLRQPLRRRNLIEPGLDVAEGGGWRDWMFPARDFSWDRGDLALSSPQNWIISTHYYHSGGEELQLMLFVCHLSRISYRHYISTPGQPGPNIYRHLTRSDWDMTDLPISRGRHDWGLLVLSSIYNYFSNTEPSLQSAARPQPFLYISVLSS